jgi:hypothetical protein
MLVAGDMSTITRTPMNTEITRNGCGTVDAIKRRD